MIPTDFITSKSIRVGEKCQEKQILILVLVMWSQVQFYPPGKVILSPLRQDLSCVLQTITFPKHGEILACRVAKFSTWDNRKSHYGKLNQILIKRVTRKVATLFKANSVM